MSSTAPVAAMVAGDRDPEVVVHAAEAVSRAERLAQVEVVQLRSLEGLRDAAAMWQHVWGRDSAPPVNTELLRALAHAGNYVGGAYQGGNLVGALLGFYGGEAGADHLHSHMLGVDRSVRSRGVGYALKLHQRLWALQRGLARVEWTFDPLVRTNAFFNLAKLGALGAGYLVDFYGPMPDEINAGDTTDRVLVAWELADARVAAAAAGTEQTVDVDAALAGGAAVALDLGHGDAPQLGPAAGDILLCRIPRDIVAMRRTDPGVALAWRKALREVMTEAMSRGLVARAMTREGWYVLGPRLRG